MNKNALIAIIAVVALVGVVGVVALGNSPESGPQDTREKYTFTDAKGVERTLPVPLENVSVVHKYIPIFMKILGVEKSVVGLDTTYGMSFKEYFENGQDIGAYSAPEGATMIKYDSHVILTPVTMGLSNADALEALGITVIYLDLTDPYMIKDSLYILAKLMGGTPEIMENYNKYMDIFNGCFTKARSFDLSAHADDVFGLFMASPHFFQAHPSSAVKVIESVSGKCYTNFIDPNTTKTVYMNQDRTVLKQVDNDYTLKYMFVYTLDKPEANFNEFFNYGGAQNYREITAVTEGHLFALGSELVNGAYSCVSSLLYAQAFGADVGTAAVDAINAINTTFGLDFSTDFTLVAYSAE